MTLARRGRSIAVSGFLLSGAIGIISSTQTWLTVERADAGEAILVPGASALPLLAPLSLAVLALGVALSIIGPILRLVFGVLAAAASLFLGWTTLQLLLTEPLRAVTPTVTETTGLAGSAAIADVVAGIQLSPWPVVTLVGWVLLLAASVVVLLTWRRWKSGGRRYRTDAAHVEASAGPVDAIDSWDDLSRGTDPTR
ncbi:Trp biosynthesis-associated membrane protein [Microbacterium hydrocarbonoxydans]|uniref:Tryptophan-associated transmembrane protein (Trp_oprn_chp) n=1 Tax=Microbacterium hydrocarbonoxydans TaxID=273678 RepID=A0A1H4M1V4_9MICO|nr:Trp biosynthesis-associated membrane protein [Microbacterium hydrocarbonoxydans]SEB77031.1 Tryptophan-associated transmembrane protein (Trp_oprn_chp) [Microbacterium hydrocarbonoxydans]